MTDRCIAGQGDYRQDKNYVYPIKKADVLQNYGTYIMDIYIFDSSKHLMLTLLGLIFRRIYNI